MESKIICTTNIDAYRKDMFPTLSVVPRVGEFVKVREPFASDFATRYEKLPTRLEVVSVTYTETAIIVELWYNKADFEAFKLLGYKLI